LRRLMIRADELRRIVPAHLSPEQMLPGAHGDLFLPFAAWVVEANSRDRRRSPPSGPPPMSRRTN
jgi:hypothetical protein